MLYFLIVIIVLLIFLNLLKSKSLLSIVQLQNIVWLYCCILYAVNYFNSYPINDVVYILATVYLFAFNLIFFFGRTPHVFLFAGRETLKTAVSNKRLIWRVCFYSLASFVIVIPLLLKSIPVVLSEGMMMARFILYSADSYFTSFEMCVIEYIFRPISSIVILFFVEELVAGRFDWKIVILTLLHCFALAFLTGGRALMIQLVFYVLFAFIATYRSKIGLMIRTNKKIIIPMMGIFIVFYVISMMRSRGGSSAFDELMLYFFASPAYFSSLINNGYVSSASTLGLASGGAFVDIYVLAMRVLGIRVDVFSVSGITKNVVAIGPSLETNATATTLLPFYSDFGIFGVLVFGFLFGLLTKAVERAVEKDTSPQCVALFLMFFSKIVLSIQNYGFGGAGTLITIVLVFWIFRSKKKVVYVQNELAY